MRSFRRRHIFPYHVQFMTEDAVRWQPRELPLRIPGLAFSELKFDGDPGRRPAQGTRAPGSGARPVRDRSAARAGVSPRAPGAPLPRGVVQAPPTLVQSVRVARRAAPDGRILFDLVAEVTQTCTVQRDGELFEMTGGCAVMIDPQGHVRYSISNARTPIAVRRGSWRRSRTIESVLAEIQAQVHAPDRDAAAVTWR